MENANIQNLIRTCELGTPTQQIVSIEELVEVGSDQAIPVLLKLLTSSDPVVRFTAVGAVAQLGIGKSKLVGAELMQLLTDTEEIVRSEAIDSLGILEYSPAVESIKVALEKDSSALVRASAAETLGDIGDPSALNNLEHALHDPDESVRAYSANSFGLLAKPSNITTLENLLISESSMRVKAEILAAQYRLGSSKAYIGLLDLIRILDDDLATSIFNILEDLLARETPSALPRDAASFCQALSTVAQRLSVQRIHMDTIITKLQAISIL